MKIGDTRGGGRKKTKSGIFGKTVNRRTRRQGGLKRELTPITGLKPSKGQRETHQKEPEEEDKLDRSTKEDIESSSPCASRDSY